MDRSPFPPRVHSYSTPALLPQLDGSGHMRSNSGYSGGIQPQDTLRLEHNNSDDALASHFLSSGPQPSEPFGGQTWLDFLRETGTHDANGPYPSFLGHHNALPTNAGDGGRSMHLQPEAHEGLSADRKRRLTAPEAPARRPGYAGGAAFMSSSRPTPGPASSSSVGNLAGSSVAMAIDLTASPSQQSYRGRAELADAVRRESDIVLPSWQPDSEVSQCPVCGNQFSFWYRKHHCRKCGRVVCANCSPHRITIPRQFIVHPPSELTGGAGATIIDLTGDPEDQTVMSSFGPYRNPALGGGEEVRVCNPCVPDPNFSPPPQHHSDQVEPDNWPFPNFDYGVNPPSPPPVQPQSRPRHTTYDSSSSATPRPHHRLSYSDISQARPDQIRNRTDPFRDRRVSFHNRSRVSDLWPPPPSTQMLPPADPHTHRDPPSRPHSHYIPQPPRHHHHHHHNHHSHHRSSASSASPSRYRSLLDVNAPLPSSPPPPPPPQPPRQIAEEDECPVCGNELPPRGPDGSEAPREAHVEECIRTHFSGSSSTPTNPAAAAAPPTSTNPSNSTVTPNPLAAPSSSSSRHRSTASSSSGAYPAPTSSSYAEGSHPRRVTASNRMLVYHATEKDCVGEDGEAQECVICFEEFEEGDEMGRLLCLCKFHRSCIRKWWETKGPGSCPTHQLHD